MKPLTYFFLGCLTLAVLLILAIFLPLNISNSFYTATNCTGTAGQIEEKTCQVEGPYRIRCWDTFIGVTVLVGNRTIINYFPVGTYYNKDYAIQKSNSVIGKSLGQCYYFGLTITFDLLNPLPALIISMLFLGAAIILAIIIGLKDREYWQEKIASAIKRKQYVDLDAQDL
jgi:hypothetical protein